MTTTVNETKIHERPTDADLEVIVNRVGRELRQSPGRSRARQRRVSLVARVAIGVGIFAAGFAVAAATVVIPAGSGFGTLLDGNGNVIPALLSIGCYDSTDATAPSTTWTENSQSDANLERQNPAAACSEMQLMTNTHQALLAEATKLRSGGATCGVISINGSSTYSWQASTTSQGDAAVEITNSPNASAPGACGSRVNISMALPSDPKTAVCTVSTNVAAVYPLESGTAQSLCAAKGEQPWGN
jgi:hypothetical protein